MAVLRAASLKGKMAQHFKDLAANLKIQFRLKETKTRVLDPCG
jgi:hypothetical protein